MSGNAKANTNQNVKITHVQKVVTHNGPQFNFQTQVNNHPYAQPYHANVPNAYAYPSAYAYAASPHPSAVIYHHSPPPAAPVREEKKQKDSSTSENIFAGVLLGGLAAGVGGLIALGISEAKV